LTRGRRAASSSATCCCRRRAKPAPCLSGGARPHRCPHPVTRQCCTCCVLRSQTWHASESGLLCPDLRDGTAYASCCRLLQICSHACMSGLQLSAGWCARRSCCCRTSPRLRRCRTWMPAPCSACAPPSPRWPASHFRHMRTRAARPPSSRRASAQLLRPSCATLETRLCLSGHDAVHAGAA